MTKQEYNQIVRKSIQSLTMFSLPFAAAFMLWGIYNMLVGGADSSFLLLGINILLIGLISALFQTAFYVLSFVFTRQITTTSDEGAIVLSMAISLLSNIAFFIVITSNLHVSPGIIFLLLILTLPAFHTLSAPFILAHYAEQVLLPKPEVQETKSIPAHHKKQLEQLAKKNLELEFTSGVYGGKEGVKLKKSKRTEKPKNDDDDYSSYLQEEMQSKQKRG